MQNIFSRSPWERQAVVVLRTAGLGQNAPTCEATAEGGQRCTDGTYLPPGCSPGSPETLQGKPLISSFPVVPVTLAIVGAAVAGKLLLGDPRARLGAEIPASALAQLTQIGDAIKSEREADAYNFSQYQSKMKESYDLLYKEKAAEEALAAQTKIWETSHRNADALQAATTALETIQTQRGTLKAEADDFRQRVDRNSQNVLQLRQSADPIIASLPPELQTDARKMIDPCAKPVMQGAFLGQVRMAPRFAVVNI